MIGAERKIEAIGSWLLQEHKKTKHMGVERNHELNSLDKEQRFLEDTQSGKCCLPETQLNRQQPEEAESESRRK